MPQALEGLIFLSLLCPSGTSGDKNDHFQGIKHRDTKIYKETTDEIYCNLMDVFAFGICFLVAFFVSRRYVLKILSNILLVFNFRMVFACSLFAGNLHGNNDHEGTRLKPKYLTFGSKAPLKQEENTGYGFH